MGIHFINAGAQQMSNSGNKFDIKYAIHDDNFFSNSTYEMSNLTYGVAILDF